jgi:hypothetical protein
LARTTTSARRALLWHRQLEAQRGERRRWDDWVGEARSASRGRPAVGRCARQAVQDVRRRRPSFERHPRRREPDAGWRQPARRGFQADLLDRGRTAVHEVGHWLNLYHIWGDDGAGCEGTDNVDDTPNQAGPNVSRPVFPHITCDNGPDGDMFVNYMDYSDDAAMLMFTEGQVTRMQAALAGPRSSFLEQPQGPQPTGQWRHNDLTVAAGAPNAAGDPAVYASLDGKFHVVYRGLDQHIHDLHQE